MRRSREYVDMRARRAMQCCCSRGWGALHVSITLTPFWTAFSGSFRYSGLRLHTWLFSLVPSDVSAHPPYTCLCFVSPALNPPYFSHAHCPRHTNQQSHPSWHSNFFIKVRSPGRSSNTSHAAFTSRPRSIVMVNHATIEIDTWSFCQLPAPGISG